MTLPLAIIPGVTGGWELLLILALVLLLFGPKRLPEIAEAMGKSIRKFKTATQTPPTRSSARSTTPDAPPGPPGTRPPASRPSATTNPAAESPRHSQETRVNLAQLLAQLKTDDRFLRNVTRWEVLPPRAGPLRRPPGGAGSPAGGGAGRAGHRAAVQPPGRGGAPGPAGRSFVVPTPTASGKTLCYNLPVLDTILREPQARALYLFPTKALSQDQMHEVHGLVTDLGADIKTFTFDGDTPETARRAIRSSGHIVVTNPDMLHQGILPHHTLWVKLFENLRYVVVDEVHQYRGVFGSHVANVLRRLQRIARFYGSDPRVHLLLGHHRQPAGAGRAADGAPRWRWSSATVRRAGEKHFIFYNPPVVNAELGIRQSVVKTTRGHRRALHGGRVPADRLRAQPHAGRAAA